MRHVGTMIAAIIIAPSAWLLLAIGQDQSTEAFTREQANSSLNSHDFVKPLLFLAAAGVLLGLIATLRFSPLGAVMTGIAYAGSYALLLVAPDRVLDTLPDNISIAGFHADATTPLRSGTTLLVGALLLVAIISIGRWRRWPDSDERYDPLPATRSSSSTMDWDRPTSNDAFEPVGPRPYSGADPWETHAPDRTSAGLSHWASSLRGAVRQSPWRR
jgi:hypothetical protein